MTDVFALKCVQRAATSHQNARPSSKWPNRARPQFPPLLQEYTLLLSHAKVFKISGQEKRPIGSVASSRYSCTFFRHAQTCIGQDERPYGACRHSALLVHIIYLHSSMLTSSKDPTTQRAASSCYSYTPAFLSDVTLWWYQPHGEAIRPASPLRHAEMSSCLALSSPCYVFAQFCLILFNM